MAIHHERACACTWHWHLACTWLLAGCWLLAAGWLPHLILIVDFTGMC